MKSPDIPGRFTATEGEWGVSVFCWPPGTWEWSCLRHGTKTVEPDATLAPLYATVEWVTGIAAGEPRPDVAVFTRDMSESDIARQAERLLSFARSAIRWVEDVLANDSTDRYTRPESVLGSAQVRDAWTPSRLSLLDQLTAQAQRGIPSPSWALLAEWRRRAGSPPVPFPQWHHPLMHKHSPVDRSFDRYASPRDKFMAGHGSAVDVRFADGSSRPATAADFPDAEQIRAWRKEAGPVTDVPDSTLEPWLPWIDWVLPEPSSKIRRRPWRRRSI